MTLAPDGWIWTSVLGFGMLGMSVGRFLASAPPAPLPKVGRFQKERDRFRAEGTWAAGVLVVLQASSAALWSVVPVKGLLLRYLSWQEHQLRLAGFPMGISPREVPVLCLTTGLLSGAFVSASGFSTIASISALFVGLALPVFRIQGLRGGRVRAAAREVPRTMDLLSLCMSAGMDLVGGLKEVSKGDKGVVADELRYLLAALEIGQTRRAALQELYENLPALEVGDFTRAIIQAEAKGASVRDALLNQATMSRQRRSVRAEELAARAGVLLTLPIMMLVVCVLLLIVGPLLVNPQL